MIFFGYGAYKSEVLIIIVNVFRRRQQNEKVIFWGIAFGVGNCSSYSNDGKGRCKREYWSAAYRIYRTTRCDSVA